MNTQNFPQKAATHTEIPAKRKRGRPRKDDNIVKRGRPLMPIPHAVSASDISSNIHHQNQVQMVSQNTVRIDNNTNNNNIIQVGQTISGVIEGIFDAGYFIAMRAGQSNTVLRGVVFKPGSFVPVTPANDIAPHVKMYQRTEFGLPVLNLQNPVNSSVHQMVQPMKHPVQPVGHSVTPMASNQVFPLGQQHFRPPFNAVPRVIHEVQVAAQKNLRMVEQDEMMQVFEVSKPSDEGTIDSGTTQNANLVIGSETQNTDMESSDQGFQEVHVSMVSEPKTSELVHQEMKSPVHDDPKEALLDGTSNYADCMPKSNVLIQEINGGHLEVVPLDEGTSVSLHVGVNNQTESEVHILTKDKTSCSDFAVEESGFQEGSTEPQEASTSATQTTELDFVVEDPAAKPSQD